MKSGKGLKISASAISLLLVGSILYVQRDKKRALLANKLLRELKNRFNPSSLGLVNEKAFDVRYKYRVLNSVSGQVIIIKEQRALQLAKQLEKAMPRWWPDKEEVIYGVFRSLADKVQVSQVASAYQKEFNMSLIDKLAGHLNGEEISTLLGIVRTLPDYRVI